MGTLVKTNGNLFPAFPSLFDDFLTRDLFDWPGSGRSNPTSVPAVNVVETDNSYELEVAAPGMEKGDFTVELENDMLVISAERRSDASEKDSEGNFTRREFNYQSFRRTFSLPERMVDGEKIKANYRDGILHIVVPKTEAARRKPKRTIKIS